MRGRPLRYLACLLIPLAAGCSPKAPGGGETPNTPFDRGRALKNLRSQAEEVAQAVLREDHRRMAELTHPAVVEKFGGPEGYARKLEAMAGEMRGQGFGFKRVTVGEPSELAGASDEVYAVVPFELEMSGPGGASGRQPSYLLAVSGDGGATWRFLDGAGVGGDRGKVKAVLPNFPDALPLPAKQPAVWDKGRRGEP